jgi:hypothetical protein
VGSNPISRTRSIGFTEIFRLNVLVRLANVGISRLHSYLINCLRTLIVALILGAVLTHTSGTAQRTRKKPETVWFA